MLLLIIYFVFLVILGIQVVILYISNKKNIRFYFAAVLEGALVMVALCAVIIVQIASIHTKESGRIYGINKETNEYLGTEGDWSEGVANWILDSVGLPELENEENVVVVEEEEPVITTKPHDPGYELFMEDVSWEEARIACESMGGHLATITSAEEQEIIEQLLLATKMYINDKGVTRIWIGASDIKTGEFTWITGEGGVITSPSDNVYTNWAIGEPSRKDPTSDILENYVSMFYHKIDECFYWNDVPIDISYWYGGRKNIAYLCEWD